MLWWSAAGILGAGMRSNPFRLMMAFVLGLGMIGVPAACAGDRVLAVNDRAPEYLARLVEAADGVEFTFLGGEKIVVNDADWLRRIAIEVRAATYRRLSPCFCESYPEIRFLKDGKRVLFLNFHHDGNVRVGSAEISGDFAVGKGSRCGIWAVVSEMVPPEANKPRRRERRQPEPSVKPEVRPVVPADQELAPLKPELPKAR